MVLCHIVRSEGSTPGKPGWKMVVRRGGDCFGNLGGGAFEAMVQADARSMLADRTAQPSVKRYYLTEDAVRGEPTGIAEEKPTATSNADEPPVPGARLGRDPSGSPAWYVPDPDRPGKYLQVGVVK